jgi:hypothetical protein
MTDLGPVYPRFGIAIATMGRWDDLHSLLDDLAAQSHPPHAVAIAHHDANGSGADRLAALLEHFAGVLPLRVAASPRGASNGRNAAAATFGDDVDWLCFPNDTSRFDADFLERLSRHCAAPTTVCAMQLVDREGPRNSLPAPGSRLTRRNAWGAIEPATAFRRADFVAVGGFDTSIGTGSDSPWQAGEGTDLVLKLSEREDFSIRWASDIIVHAHTEFAHLPADERRRKLRNYGRGAGHLLRKWHYPLWYKLAHLLAAALMPLRNPGKFSPADGLALLTGRTEGILGRLFSKETDHRAVIR